MTKKELIKRLSSRCNISISLTKTILDEFFEITKEELGEGRDICLSGFGKFEIVDIKQRVGMNPRKKEQVIIPAQKVVRFRCGSCLKEKIKNI